MSEKMLEILIMEANAEIDRNLEQARNDAWKDNAFENIKKD